MFRYEAVDRAGRRVSGAMQVADEASLNARLHVLGYQPTQIHARGLRPVSAPARTAPLKRAAAAASGVRRDLTASPRALARMYHQLHLALRAGMPAYQALTTVQGQVHDRVLAEALGELALGVQQGERISVSMERFPALFSRGDVGMLRAAELAGFLPEAFAGLAERHEQDDRTRRRLGVFAWLLHLNWLTFLLLLAAAAFFRAAFEAGFDTGAGVRAVGRALLTLTLPGLVLYAGAAMAFARFRRRPESARRWHALLLRLPIAGSINRLRAHAVFTRTLSLLHRAALSRATAWEAAAAAVPNLALAERYHAGMAAVEQAGSFAAAMRLTGLFDAADAGMIATGEATGETDQALAYLAARCEEDTRVALGSSVVRGALGCGLAGLALGMVGEFVVLRSYYGDIVRLVGKAMGVEE